ncbi:MAG: AAA family ATPase, partial [Planctomycetes bacterium]|nr:AAA family ATPase [Planctomycetota bacterium]
MIIQDLQANNFMRFHKVDLSHLPQKGTFCIQGDNESGKSTIGILIHFILSGECYKGGQATDLINWEKDQLKAQMLFTHNGVQYQILRQVDRDGEHFAKLMKGDDILAQGRKQVHAHLEGLLGYSQETGDTPAYMITHGVVQKLILANSSTQVEKTLGLDNIRSLIHHSQENISQLQEKLSVNGEQAQKLQGDVDNVGYSEEKENGVNQRLKELEEQKEKIKTDMKALTEPENITQHNLNTVEQELKLIHVKNNDEEQLNKLKNDIPSIIDRLSSMQTQDKSEELKKQST